MKLRTFWSLEEGERFLEDERYHCHLPTKYFPELFGPAGIRREEPVYHGPEYRRSSSLEADIQLIERWLISMEIAEANAFYDTVRA